VDIPLFAPIHEARDRARGVALEQACPRYFGACADSRPARLAIEWRGPRKLRALMDEPALGWDVPMGSSLLFAAMNLVAPLIPERLYRRPLMLGLFALGIMSLIGLGVADPGSTNHSWRKMQKSRSIFRSGSFG